jgi:hypothetical protein
MEGGVSIFFIATLAVVYVLLFQQLGGFLSALHA